MYTEGHSFSPSLFLFSLSLGIVFLPGAVHTTVCRKTESGRGEERGCERKGGRGFLEHILIFSAVLDTAEVTKTSPFFPLPLHFIPSPVWAAGKDLAT